MQEAVESCPRVMSGKVVPVDSEGFLQVRVCFLVELLFGLFAEDMLPPEMPQLRGKQGASMKRWLCSQS